jgi:hypothetical protein
MFSILFKSKRKVRRPISRSEQRDLVQDSIREGDLLGSPERSTVVKTILRVPV